jgi:Mn-dependent DtxR family transcriptional regulator
MEVSRMTDDCLLDLYQLLIPDARTVFDALAQDDGPCTMERLMLSAQITNQQVRKGVWGLASTGLIIYTPGRPIRISDNGARLASLLAEEKKSLLLARERTSK